MLIMAALLLLMLAVGGWHLRLLVRGSAWVKNSYIKKCFLEPTAPKATRGDVQASLVVALDRAGNEGFTSQRLKRWLCCHVVAYFPQQTGCEVSHLIVPEGWVTADWTGQCMANGVRLATRALWWQRLWLPAITQAQSVAKCSLV